MNTTLTVLPLIDQLRDVARDPELLELLEPHATERRWSKIYADHQVELWLISWPPGATTGWHDHGTAHGAFITLQGALTEDSWEADRPGRLLLSEGDVRAFASGHVHDVRNEGAVPALSLHAYAPRLVSMTRYQFDGSQLYLTGIEQAGDRW